MRVLSRLVCCLILLSLSACQVYRCKFECPPGKGVPCTPVTTLEKMIVETPENEPNIFLGYLPPAVGECKKLCNKTKSLKQMKVWIEPRKQPCGLCIEGHYIYINKKEICHD